MSHFNERYASGEIQLRAALPSSSWCQCGSITVPGWRLPLIYRRYWALLTTYFEPYPNWYVADFVNPRRAGQYSHPPIPAQPPILFPRLTARLLCSVPSHINLFQHHPTSYCDSHCWGELAAAFLVQVFTCLSEYEFFDSCWRPSLLTSDWLLCTVPAGIERRLYPGYSECDHFSEFGSAIIIATGNEKR